MKREMNWIPPPVRFFNPSESRSMTGKSSCWAVGAALVLAAGPAWAYVDPGTGSMLVQSALAIIAVALVAGRSAWHKVKSFFSRRKDDADDREA